MRRLKFIDLFAGLGGFHLALKELGHECVFASELNIDLRKLYERNHKTIVSGDINEVDVKSIPSHNILCAGFPCQPFSKAGAQLGLSDPSNGNLFYRIKEILNEHKPEFLFLENVPNLKSHDQGNTWKVICKELSELYDIQEEILSPHQLGIPQHRSRIYIVGRLKINGGLKDFKFPAKNQNGRVSIHDIIIEDDTDVVPLRADTKHQLEVWQEFLDHLRPENVPRFPIWAMEFGADYPFEKVAPVKLKSADLKGRKGAFGRPLIGHSFEDLINDLPIYAQNGVTGNGTEFPEWKKKYIRQNRIFYETHKRWLKKWIPKVMKFENSHQKFEWNCGKVELIIKDKIVQFRPSGIRVKMPTFSPALVLTTTQIPIFPWLDRYMTRKEAAKLQCMDGLKEFPNSTSKAFNALGNAVNVQVVKSIAKNLLK